MDFLTLPNVLIIGLTAVILMTMKEMKRLQLSGPGDMVPNPASPMPTEGRKIAVAGNIHARPAVMAAIQETKTSVMDHFVKKKFKDPAKKDLPHLTAS